MKGNNGLMNNKQEETKVGIGARSLQLLGDVVVKRLS